MARRRPRPRAGAGPDARRAPPAVRASPRGRLLDPDRERLLSGDRAGRVRRGDGGDGTVDRRQVPPPDHRGTGRGPRTRPPSRPHHLGLGGRGEGWAGPPLRPRADDDRGPAYPPKRFVIGSRRSRPNAFGVILIPGAAWRRLYSARSTILTTSSTTSAGSPA